MIRSKLRPFLEARGISAYRLALKIGQHEAEPISNQTVYAIARDDRKPDAKSLDQIITALRRMTGEKVQVGDLLEYVEPE